MSDELLRKLCDIATGKVQHVYGGACPNVAGEGEQTANDRADPLDECPACDILRDADAFLASSRSPKVEP